MLHRAVTFALASLFLALAAPLSAAELVMVEQRGCAYCIEWNRTIGPIYPKTAEGTYAPLRHADLHEGPPEGVTYARKVVYTPTFILIDEAGQELSRIEGYPGEDFFWGLLGMMLKAKTDFPGTG